MVQFGHTSKLANAAVSGKKRAYTLWIALPMQHITYCDMVFPFASVAVSVRDSGHMSAVL